MHACNGLGTLCNRRPPSNAISTVATTDVYAYRQLTRAHFESIRPGPMAHCTESVRRLALPRRPSDAVSLPAARATTTVLQDQPGSHCMDSIPRGSPRPALQPTDCSDHMAAHGDVCARTPCASASSLLSLCGGNAEHRFTVEHVFSVDGSAVAHSSGLACPQVQRPAASPAAALSTIHPKGSSASPSSGSDTRKPCRPPTVVHSGRDRGSLEVPGAVGGRGIAAPPATARLATGVRDAGLRMALALQGSAGGKVGVGLGSLRMARRTKGLMHAANEGYLADWKRHK
jgi:hypothetical protein